MIKNKKRQLNVRLDDLSFSRIDLLKQKLHFSSNTTIIEYALIILCERCNISLDELVNNIDQG